MNEKYVLFIKALPDTSPSRLCVVAWVLFKEPPETPDAPDTPRKRRRRQPGERGRELVEGTQWTSRLDQLADVIVPKLLPQDGCTLSIIADDEFGMVWHPSTGWFEKWRAQDFRGRKGLTERWVKLNTLFDKRSIRVTSRKPETPLDKKYIGECEERADALRTSLSSAEEGIPLYQGTADFLFSDDEEDAKAEWTDLLVSDRWQEVRSFRCGPHLPDETCIFHSGYGWCLSRREPPRRVIDNAKQ